MKTTITVCAVILTALFVGKELAEAVKDRENLNNRFWRLDERVDKLEEAKEE